MSKQIYTKLLPEEVSQKQNAVMRNCLKAILLILDSPRQEIEIIQEDIKTAIDRYCPFLLDKNHPDYYERAK